MSETQKFTKEQLTVLLELMGDRNINLDTLLDMFVQSTPDAISFVLPRLPSQLLRDIAHVTTERDAYLLEYLLDLKSSDFAERSQWVVQTVLVAAAANPLVPLETLTRLAEDPDWNIRRGVAKNKITPPELLKILSQDGEYAVRRNVAGHKNIPDELLPVLAKDKHARVRGSVCKNKKTPLALKVATICSADAEARQNIAQSKKTHPEVLAQLRSDKNQGVRRILARRAAA